MVMNGLERLKSYLTRRVAVILILFGFAAYWSIYTVRAYWVVVEYTYTFGVWKRGLQGSLFPWPFAELSPQGPEGGTVELSPVDRYIYLYLIRTGLLVLGPIILWVLAVFALIQEHVRRTIESQIERLRRELGPQPPPQ